MTLNKNNLFITLVVILLTYPIIGIGQQLKPQSGLFYTDNNFTNYFIDVTNGETIFEIPSYYRNYTLESIGNYIIQISANDLYYGDYLSIYDLKTTKLITRIKCDHCYNTQVRPIIWNDDIIVAGKKIYSYKINKINKTISNEAKILSKRDSYYYNSIKIFNDHLYFLGTNTLDKYNLKTDSLIWSISLVNDFRNSIIGKYNDNIIVASDGLIYSIDERDGNTNWKIENEIQKKRDKIYYPEFKNAYIHKDLLYAIEKLQIGIINLKNGIKIDSIKTPQQPLHLYGINDILYYNSYEFNKSNYLLSSSYLGKIDLNNKKHLFLENISTNVINNIFKIDKNLVITARNEFIIFDEFNNEIKFKRNKEGLITQPLIINTTFTNNYDWFTIKVNKKIFDKTVNSYIELGKVPNFKLYYKTQKNILKEVEELDRLRENEGIFAFKAPRNSRSFVLKTNPNEIIGFDRNDFITSNFKQTLFFQAYPLKMVSLNFKPYSSKPPKMEIPIQNQRN